MTMMLNEFYLQKKSERIKMFCSEINNVENK